MWLFRKVDVPAGVMLVCLGLSVCGLMLQVKNETIITTMSLAWSL